jgi:putative two-component system response regulator
LAGTEIPLAGRICAVCDVLDALVSERPYKRAWSFDAALAKIVRDSGTHFDPRVVAALQRLAPQLRRELAGSGAGETADARESAGDPQMTLTV